MSNTRILVIGVRHAKSGRGTFFDAVCGVPPRYHESDVYQHQTFELITEWLPLCTYFYGATSGDLGKLFSHRNELLRRYGVSTIHMLMDHDDDCTVERQFGGVRPLAFPMVPCPVSRM